MIHEPLARDECRAEKLRRAVMDTPFSQGASQPTGRITISLGVSTFPADAQTQEALVDCSDSALYASKRAGRNRTTVATHLKIAATAG